MKTLGVILAGGRSRRMGADKARTILEGRTMLDWVFEALSQVVSEVRKALACWHSSTFSMHKGLDYM